MADELLGVLTRFHREVVLPDIERIVEEKISGQVAPFREQVLSNFDAVFQRIDKLALRSELEDLKHRVHDLEQRIAELEAQI